MANEGFPTTLAAGASKTVQCPFNAVCALVNNPTQQWLSFPDNLVDGFVAPGAQQVIVNLPGLESVQLQWAAPPNVTQPAAVPGQQAAIRLFDYQIPYSGFPTQQTVAIVGNVTATVSGNVSVTGGTINATIQNASLAVTNFTGTVLATAQNAKLLATFSSVPNGTAQSASIAVDPGCQGVVVAVAAPDGSSGCFSDLEVWDGAFNHNYFKFAPTFPAGQMIWPVPLPPYDNASRTVGVRITEGACGVVNVNVWEILQGMDALLEVIPLPSQFPNQAPLKFEGIVNAGAFATIVAAAAGVEILPFHCKLSMSPTTLTLGSGGSQGVVAALTDNGGGYNWHKGIYYVPAYTSNTGGVGGGPLDIPFSGAPGPRGTGMYLANPNGLNLNYYGDLEYSLS